MGAEFPIAISFIVGMIGVLGIVAGFIARNGIRREKETLDKGKARLEAMANSNWGGKTSPDAWLAAEGLQADSHFGDRLRSIWGGWLVGRVPTLMELHNLSDGRERRRLWARLAGGITALLVVSGIAGTLFCIHPILDGFNIAGDASGVVESSKRAESAMAMIQSLGRAFWPSLTALVFTFIVASGRGYYLHAASKLAWELDGLSVDDLFPRFRVRTFGEELLELQSKVSKLIDAIQTRDVHTGTLVDTLTVTVTALETSQTGLQSAAESVAKAAESLMGDANAVRTDLATHLGEHSHLVQGLATVAAAAHANQQAAEILHAAGNALSAAGHALSTTTEAGTRALIATSRTAAKEAAAAVSGAAESAADRLQQTVAGVPQAIRVGTVQAGQAVVEASRLAAAEATASLQAHVEPIRTAATEIHNANAALQTHVRESLSASLDEFGESSTAVLNRFQSTIGTTAKQLTSSGQAVRDAVEMANELFERVDTYRNIPSWPRKIWGQFTEVIRKIRRPAPPAKPRRGGSL